MTAAAPEGGPNSELGYVQLPGWDYFGAQGVTAIAGDELEDVPELRWPNSIFTYHRMRNDSQIDALSSSVCLPVGRLKWSIDPAGAPDEVVEDCCLNLNLPVRGQTELPARQRVQFRHDEHLQMALLAPTVYGHMPFELVGDVDDATLAWRLSALSPRLPQTLSRISVRTNGSLDSITQGGSMTPGNYLGTRIPAEQLAMYVWKREGGNWTGRSMLRPLYKHFILKDRLLRIDAMKNERFGAGVPVGTAPVGGDPAQYQRTASAVRASENGGVGLANGATMDILGIKGTLPDTLGSIRYQDEAMARSFLAMFIQLGSTETGSRALGEQFVNFFTDALAAFANWYADTTTRDVLERLVDWNFGTDVVVPKLIWEEKDEEPLGVTDLSELVKSGALVVDAEMQTWIRDKWAMPKYEGGTPLPTKPATPIQINPGGTGDAVTPDASNPGSVAANAARRHRHAAASSQTVNNPGTVGHREPNAIEVRAGTDFTKMQQAWEKQTTDLVGSWAEVQAKQIDALVKSVEEAVKAGDDVALATLQAPVLGEELILEHMKTMATSSIAAAKSEATAQGVTVDASLDDIVTALEGRAKGVAALLSRSIADSASRNALLRYGTDSDAADVAAGVREQLEGLSDSFLNDSLGGSLTQAQNAGRRLVMNSADGKVDIYSSELLDENTCEACAEVDGTGYTSQKEADDDYPTGGYVECFGGPRCRGTLVAVYGESE